MQTPTPNPDTHCPTCHEPLSTYGHCWQHHYPPMDPSQDAKPAPALPAYGEAVLAYTPDSRWVKAHLEPALDGWPAYWQSSGQLHWNLGSVLRWKPLAPATPYCNGQCGICSCISSSSTAAATPNNG